MRGDSRTVLALPRETEVEVQIFDLAGHRVRSLAGGLLPAGYHVLTWDGRDERGKRAAAGVYFLRASAGSESRSRKLILLD
jgi:flagellar hook assembly protein FlgD